MLLSLCLAYGVGFRASKWINIPLEPNWFNSQKAYDKFNGRFLFDDNHINWRELLLICARHYPQGMQNAKVPPIPRCAADVAESWGPHLEQALDHYVKYKDTSKDDRMKPSE